MDAREQLRRYLEQRREMGERELILDGMSVEDVMRIVGAGGSATRDATPASRRSPEQRAEPPVAETPRAAPPADESASDWREVLRATGSAPTRATSAPKPST